MVFAWHCTLMEEIIQINTTKHPDPVTSSKKRKYLSSNYRWQVWCAVTNKPAVNQLHSLPCVQGLSGRIHRSGDWCMRLYRVFNKDPNWPIHNRTLAWCIPLGLISRIQYSCFIEYARTLLPYCFRQHLSIELHCWNLLFILWRHEFPDLINIQGCK